MQIQSGARKPLLSQHVGGDAGVPALRFLVSRLAQIRAFAGLGNEAVDLGDFLRRCLVGGTDLDAVIGRDQRPACVGKLRRKTLEPVSAPRTALAQTLACEFAENPDFGMSPWLEASPRT